MFCPNKQRSFEPFVCLDLKPFILSILRFPTGEDLVPEQASEAKERVRGSKPAGAAADGGGSLQPLHHRRQGQRQRQQQQRC